MQDTKIKFEALVVVCDADTMTSDFVEEVHTERADAETTRDRIEEKLPDHKRVTRQRITPLVTCRCKEEVRCEKFTNTCDNCGREYNMFGQHLAPRGQWGTETGEHPSDCV